MQFYNKLLPPASYISCFLPCKFPHTKFPVSYAPLFKNCVAYDDNKFLFAPQAPVDLHISIFQSTSRIFPVTFFAYAPKTQSFFVEYASKTKKGLQAVLLHMKYHLRSSSAFLILGVKIYRTVIWFHIEVLQQEHTHLLRSCFIRFIGTLFHVV
mgnify:CR=1 FL=1